MKTQEYDISGKKLTMNEEGEFSNIPESCPECNCVQVENWKDFSNNTIQVCGQCSHEMHVQLL